MTLSAAERREINRQNARQSTGPSELGKMSSRENALTHGLRAEALALPHEDPELVQARTQAWHDYYQPKSPGAHHLVNQCIQATLLADPSHHHHAPMTSHHLPTP